MARVQFRPGTQPNQERASLPSMTAEDSGHQLAVPDPWLASSAAPTWATGRRNSRSGGRSGNLRCSKLTDVEQRGYLDARLSPHNPMSADDIADWTAAFAPNARD